MSRKSGEAQFHDAVILETIANHARGRYQKILIVSADGDFSEAAISRLSKVSGADVQRGRDLEHAAKLVSEERYQLLREFVRASQTEVRRALEQNKEALFEALRLHLKPREEMLTGDQASTDLAEQVFWARHSIVQIVAYTFGALRDGGILPSFFGPPLRDQWFRVAELTVDVQFDLRLATPLAADGPRYTLPGVGDGQRRDQEFMRSVHERTVVRPVSFVVSYERDNEGNVRDVRLEAVDGQEVAGSPVILH